MNKSKYYFVKKDQAGINEDNKLIAKFMGIDSENLDETGEYHSDNLYFFNDEYFEGGIEFDQSWDLLMPVLDHIEAVLTRNNKQGPKVSNYDRTFIEYCDGMYFCTIQDLFTQADSKIEAVYGTILKYINAVNW